MQHIFDWIRRCRSGPELIAILQFVREGADVFPEAETLGPPHWAFERPCLRCRFYPALASSAMMLCKTCAAILARAQDLGTVARHSLLAWGFVNRIPRSVIERNDFYADPNTGVWVQSDHHFLAAIDGWRIKNWLQEMLLYHGTDLKGLIQFFPTCGDSNKGTMGDVLCRVIHHCTRFPMDILRIRFFSSPFQVFAPHLREQKGMLTFEVTEFIRWLEMATVFRSLLRPETQEMLEKLTELKNVKEERFYWGRFMGYLTPEARDMLDAWKIRQWPRRHIRLLYELIRYVVFTT